MDENQLPSADEQIVTRLQNTLHNVLTELESQGTERASITGSYVVTVTAGVISVEQPPVVGRVGKTKPVDATIAATE